MNSGAVVTIEATEKIFGGSALFQNFPFVIQQ
jgi:hypothetical protein